MRAPRKEKEARSQRVKLTLFMVCASMVLAVIIVWTVVDRAIHTKSRIRPLNSTEATLAPGALAGLFAGNQNAVLAISRMAEAERRRQELAHAHAEIAPYERGQNVFEGVGVELLSGGAVELDRAYADTATLVVNVASHCGFTQDNYKQLEAIHRRFRRRNFVVLAFPCNQFGQQEPGSAKEIMHFARREKGATFPLFEKVDVNGPSAHPLYRRLKMAANVSAIEWNFGKFLVDRHGVPQRYFRHDAPFPPIVDAIEALLAGSEQERE
jgi:glutathione peroxidase